MHRKARNLLSIVAGKERYGRGIPSFGTRWQRTNLVTARIDQLASYDIHPRSSVGSQLTGIDIFSHIGRFERVDALP